jgi:hypothetical protein
MSKRGSVRIMNSLLRPAQMLRGGESKHEQRYDQADERGKRNDGMSSEVSRDYNLRSERSYSNEFEKPLTEMGRL